MTRPTIGELLSGVAASLRESVLPEIPAGPSRRQLQAAIAIVRRISMVWDKVGPYLYADNKDISQTLGRIAATLSHPSMRGSRLAAVGERLLASLNQPELAKTEYPSASALATRNVELQSLLVELQETIDAPLPTEELQMTAQRCARSEILTMLHALHRRMLERELEVTAIAPVRK